MNARAKRAAHCAARGTAERCAWNRQRACACILNTPPQARCHAHEVRLRRSKTLFRNILELSGTGCAVSVGPYQSGLETLRDCSGTFSTRRSGMFAAHRDVRRTSLLFFLGGGRPEPELGPSHTFIHSSCNSAFTLISSSRHHEGGGWCRVFGRSAVCSVTW